VRLLRSYPAQCGSQASRRIRAGVAIAVVAGAVWSGCSKPSAQRTRAREEKPRPVATEPVKHESLPRSIEVVGTLAAEDQVTISSQADGAVSKVYVDLGDRVHSGQVLLELDREKLEYNLELQKAALTRALARYGATEPGRLPPVEQTPDVQKAAAELQQAKQAYDRASELFGRQLLPRQALDDAQATLRTKQAIYDSALQNAQTLGVDVSSSNATVKLADRQLRDALIRAPFDGYVQKRLVSVGEFVKNQTPVMAIVRMDPLKVTAEIPERMTPWVKVDQSVEIRVDAFPDKPITGRVSRISPTVNTQTRAFPFEALIANGDGQLKPGTFARVRLATALLEPVLTIPYAALQYRYGVYRAFTVQENRLVIHELQTGDRVGDRMEILSGIKLGDNVVLTDVDNLADGMAVSPEAKDVKDGKDAKPGKDTSGATDGERGGNVKDRREAQGAEDAKGAQQARDASEAKGAKQE
jgi:RND family efflux transporter MFP subunit